MADRAERSQPNIEQELRAAGEEAAAAQAAGQAQQEELKRQKKKKRRRRDLISLLVRLLLLAAVIFVLFFIIIGVTSMPNGDMYPRVDAGDLVLFYRLDKDVKAQDIIVFEKDMSQVVKDERRAGTSFSASPARVKTAGKEQFICRVVAVAGDTVEITESGNLIINGSTMIESNIYYSTYPYLGYTEYPVKLGEGECFVLADSRQGGADSRFFGPVHVSEIKGTVITILRRNNL